MLCSNGRTGNQQFASLSSHFHYILLTQFLPVTIFRFIVSKLIPPIGDQA